MLYITSDWHLQHGNMITGGTINLRDFNSLDNMQSTLMKSINSVVKPEDTLIHAGDLFFGKNREDLLDFLWQLNGRIIFVYGNHDSSALMNYLKRNNYAYRGRDKFEFHEVGYRIKHNGHYYNFTHFPMPIGSDRNHRNLCGHIHQHAAPLGSLNIGVDSPEIGDRPFGQPLSLNEVSEIYDKKYLKIELHQKK